MPGLDDHERPLNRRGKAAAPVMAQWLAARGLLPDRILCSPSQRTRQTVTCMRTAVAALPEPELVPALYHAMPEDIREAVRRAPASAQTVMIVGHEPGLSAAASLLCTSAPAPGAALMHFPTAAVAVFDVDDADWTGLDWSRARFVDFARPRDLMA